MSSTQQLLCVTGLSPQIVTETLYALQQSGADMPTSIHILSTQEGAQRARLTLISEGWMAKFYQDYQLSPPESEHIHIEALTDAEGQFLFDVRTQQDNRSLADGITEKIRQLTEDDNTALHVSIAGGRKTMGFYAGYALSLYGREQDRLSHILVSAEYESHPQFCYPTPYSQVIYAHDPTRKPLDTQHAQVMLANIDFVRLRHGLDKSLLQGKSSFTESIKRAQQSFAPAKLFINIKRKQLIAASQSLHLKPVDMTFYTWILHNQLQHNKLLCCPSEGAPDMTYANEFIKHYRRNEGDMGVSQRTIKTLEQGMEKSFFEQHKSAINQTIKTALGINADSYLIHSQGKRPHTEYIIKLEAHQIEYQEE